MTVFPLIVRLQSAEGGECVITLNADGSWQGAPDQLKMVLDEMAESSLHPSDCVVLWMLLREMQRDAPRH